MFIALSAGAVMYYLQVRAFNDVVVEKDTTIRLTSIVSGAPEKIIANSFEGIDNASSSIAFRGCFTTPMSLPLLTETYVYYDAAAPLAGPGWFSCYDAKVIGADLENGVAFSFLGEADITEGVDRVVAIYDDGRAFVWNQPNETDRE